MNEFEYFPTCFEPKYDPIKPEIARGKNKIKLK